MHLDRIEIEGFKSIREQSLELRALNVLIGANGAGKSNLVSLFGLLRELVGERLQVAITRAGGAASLLHHGPKRTPSMRVKVHSDKNQYELVLAHAAPDRLFFEREVVWGPSQVVGNMPVRLGSGHVETQLHAEAARHPNGFASWVIARLGAWKVYHFHDTSPSAPVKQKGRIDDNDSLRPDAGNLAAFLHRLRQSPDEQGAYRRIVAAVRQVAPFFDDFHLRPDPLSPQTIQLEWSERGSDAYFNAHALSDGTLRFICLATLLLQPRPPSLVVIDEPELGLHPYAIAQLAAMLQSVVSRPMHRVQVLIATQSVTLMNQFAPEDLIIVDRLDGQSTFRRVTAEQVEVWADEYSLGEVWEKNILGGRPQQP